MSEPRAEAPGHETPAFRAAFRDLLAWRRDVRSFRRDPVPDALVDEILQAAAFAPSVGLSQPWRFVRLRSEEARTLVRENFERCNADALAGYRGDRASRYARLKLSGLREAPLQLAVFSDHATDRGRGLGRRTMPEMLDYSVAIAIHCIWLSARTHGVGLGWVSIVDPAALSSGLQAPASWRLVAVLCMGWPATTTLTPELELEDWEFRRTDPIETIDR